MKRAFWLVCVFGLTVAGSGARAGGFGPGHCDSLARRIAQLEWRIALRPAPSRNHAQWTRRALGHQQRKFANRCVGLHQIQSLGTHNSYHVEPRANLLDVLLQFSPDFAAWEYSHLPLEEQLGVQGIRQLELDVFRDGSGGLFAERRGRVAVGEDPVSGIPELDAPGAKVLHVQDLDFETRCFTFTGCLEQVRAWSDAHPRHLPISILVELKEESIPDPLQLGFAVPELFDGPGLDALENEILAVFPPERILLPDDVRGDRASLAAAVTEDGWPRLGATRGRVLFLMDDGGEKRALYRAGSPNLAGRVLFTNAQPGDADAAFVKRNDPEADFGEIQALVRAGYLVRTRADADTVEARSGDTARRDAALASGAQLVSTDYPEDDSRFAGEYLVSIPEGAPARCNPVNAPPGCREAALEGRLLPRR